MGGDCIGGGATTIVGGATTIVGGATTIVGGITKDDLVADLMGSEGFARIFWPGVSLVRVGGSRLGWAKEGGARVGGASVGGTRVGGASIGVAKLREAGVFPSLVLIGIELLTSATISRSVALVFRLATTLFLIGDCFTLKNRICLM